VTILLRSQAAKPDRFWPRYDDSSSFHPCKKSFSFSRTFKLAALAAAILTTGHNGSAQSASLPTEQAGQAQALVNTAGVNTHLTYTNTAYFTDWPTVLSDLQQLGVKHIRDGYYTLQGPNDPIALEHRQLAQIGITTDYVVPYGADMTPSTVQNFAQAVGDMESLEAPNECDILGDCDGGGNIGIGNVVGYLPWIDSAAQSVNVPVMGPSYVLPSSYPTTGSIASLMNINSIHEYFGGRNPGSTGWGAPDAQGNAFGSLQYWLDMSNIDAPGITPAITETGYISFPSTATPYTVPESVAESYTLRTLLLDFKYGYQETFFYQLLDDPSSPAGYGLLRSDMSQKPSFTALSNLLNLLSDPGGSFTPGSLPYQILGGDSNVDHLLLEKSDGSFWLPLWLEEPSWDPANVVSIPVAPENIGINLGSGYTTTTDYQFDQNGNVTAFNQPMNGSIAPLTITNEVSIVRIVAQ